jgi:hypothetical protein
VKIGAAMPLGNHPEIVDPERFSAKWTTIIKITAPARSTSTEV